MPMPAASASIAKSRRTSVGSTPSARARPTETPATTRPSGSRAGILLTAPSYGALRPRPSNRHAAEADVGVEYQLARAPGAEGVDVELLVPAFDAAAQHLDVSGARAGVDLEIGVCRHADRQLPEAHVRLDVRLAGWQVGPAQVEHELTGCDVVLPVEVGRGGGADGLVADRAFEADVHGRDEHRERGEENPDEEEPAGAHVQERSGGDRSADRDRADGERDVPRNVDAEHAEECEQAGRGEQEPEDRERDRLAARGRRLALGGRGRAPLAPLRPDDRDERDADQQPGSVSVLA